MNEADQVDHSVCSSLYLTSSFRKKSVNHPNRSHMSYSRMDNPNFDELHCQLKMLYDTSKCILFPSGVNAIHSLFSVYAKNDITFIVGNEMYYHTFKTLKYLKEKYPKFEYCTVDICDSDQILKCVTEKKDTLAMVFFESCTNPRGYILDYSILAKIKYIIPKCKIVIDNSWLNGIVFNPLKHDADIVMESLSKYIGGGRIIMGSLLGSEDQLKAIQEYITYAGIRTSQYDCWVASDSIRTLSLRMKVVSETAIEVAKYLENVLEDIMYPMLKSHPSYELAAKYFNFSPGLIYFCIPLKKEEALKWLDSSKIIQFATSYGKSHSLFDPYPEEIDGKTWVRLSIGWESNKVELINELERMLNNIILTKV